MAKAQPRAVSFTNEEIISAATGRWGEVAGEIKPASPYIIDKPDGSQIVIPPLTRRRRKTLKAAQANYLMIGAQLAEVQNDQNVDQGTISRIQRLMEESERAYDDALFGAVAQEVYDYYDDLDEAFWNAMYQDVHDQLVNRVDLVQDHCTRCGRPFEEPETEGGASEGKDEPSSTSSTDTGTK